MAEVMTEEARGKCEMSWEDYSLSAHYLADNPALVDMVRRARDRGDGIAVYQQQSMDSANFGTEYTISIGGSAAQLQVKHPEPPPAVLPVYVPAHWGCLLVAYVAPEPGMRDEQPAVVQRADVVKPRTVYIQLDQDVFADSPNEWDGPKVWTFLRAGSKSPMDFDLHLLGDDEDELSDDEIERKEEVERQLEDGELFLLSVYRHGAETWSLMGEGTQCRFDTANGAGVIELGDVGENVSYEDRERIARAVLNEWNEWCNGEVYVVSPLDPITKEPISDFPVGGVYASALQDFILNEVLPCYDEDVVGNVVLQYMFEGRVSYTDDIGTPDDIRAKLERADNA